MNRRTALTPRGRLKQCCRHSYICSIKPGPGCALRARGRVLFHSSLFILRYSLLLYFPHPGFPFKRDRERYPLSVKRRRVFLFAAKKEPKNRRRFRRGGRTTKGPAGPLESLRLAPGDPVRLGQGNARLAVQAHAPETPVFRPPIENGEQRFPIPLRGRLLQASIRPELPEEGKRFSILLFLCGHIQCRHAFRCFSFLHSGFLSRLWGCLSSAHLPYTAWKTGARKRITHTRQKPLA